MDSFEIEGTGRKVSRYWLGTVAFGAWGNADHDSCELAINLALDSGITAIDTADSYADGESEVIVGKAIRTRRDEVFVGTKFGLDPSSERIGQVTGETVGRSLEASLRRLDTDYVDLYQIHRLGSDVDIDDVLAGLDDAVRSGKVLAVGTSMLAPERIVELQLLARQGAHVRPTTEQPPYSVFVREVERSVLPTCRTQAIHVLAHAPLNGGWLAGHYRPDVLPPPDSRAVQWPVRRDRYDRGRPEVQEKLQLVGELLRLAESRDLSLIELATRFVMSNPLVDAVIIGPRMPEQVKSAVPDDCAPLDSELLGAIDRLVRPGDVVDPLDVAYYRSRAGA